MQLRAIIAKFKFSPTLKMEDGRINVISVADPSRKLNGILLTFSGIYNAGGDNFQTFTDNSNQQTLILVDLPQGVYAGRSVNIRHIKCIHRMTSRHPMNKF